MAPMAPMVPIATPVATYPGTVAARLRPRRPLLEVALAGRRASWHAVVRWAIAGFALLAALLVALEPHRVCDAWGSCDASDWGPWHTLARDQGVAPFALLALVVALQRGAYRSKLLASVLTALGTFVIGLIYFGSTALTHFLSHVDGGDGAVFCGFAVTVLALAQVVLEPVLVVGQRRALEATDPVFPRAAVVTH